MSEALGGLLSVLGLFGVLVFGYQYLQDSATFNVFGAELAVTTGDITPVLISGFVLLVGSVIWIRKSSVPSYE